jgi:hypothetical protein
VSNGKLAAAVAVPLPDAVARHSDDDAHPGAQAPPPDQADAAAVISAGLPCGFR